MRRRTAARSARTGRSCIGSVVVRQAGPVRPGLRIPADTVRPAPPGAPTTASSGVVTVRRTADPATCSARDDVGIGDAEGEADHGRRRRQHRLDLAGVVVVVPRRLAEGHPEGGGVGLELREVGGQTARDRPWGRPGRRGSRRTRRRRRPGPPPSPRPGRPPSCTRRPGSPARPPRRSPPRARPSTAHPPWAPRRAASGRAPPPRPAPVVVEALEGPPSHPHLPTGRYGGQPVDLDLVDTLRSTGAARQFHPEPVDDEVLARLLDTARFAPSGGNRQAGGSSSSRTPPPAWHCATST